MISFLASIFSALLLSLATGESYTKEGFITLLGILLFVLIIYLGLFVLRAVATCIMAKKRKIKWWWAGMLPYVSYSLLGKLAGPVRIFSIDIKNVGLIVSISAFVLDLASVLFYAVPVIEIYTALNANATITAEFIANLQVGMFYNVIQMFSYFTDWIFVFSYILLVFTLFTKYAPQKRILYTVISLVQPIFSILLLTVMNNKTYNSVADFYKEKMAKRYGQTYNPYQNPYNTSENPFETEKQNNENPFDEY